MRVGIFLLVLLTEFPACSAEQIRDRAGFAVGVAGELADALVAHLDRLVGVAFGGRESVERGALVRVRAHAHPPAARPTHADLSVYGPSIRTREPIVAPSCVSASFIAITETTFSGRRCHVGPASRTGELDACHQPTLTVERVLRS